MRYKAGHRDVSKASLIAAAGRGFRRQGYGGLGVDALAREAGVTSGAFYGHFASKEAAFEAAVLQGLTELREGVAGFQAELGPRWLAAFVDFYLERKRTCDLADGCGLQTLVGDVTRATDSLRRVYQQELEKVVAVIAGGLPQRRADRRDACAWALLALLSGGVTMLRGLADEAVAAHAVPGLRDAALAIAAQAT